MEEEFGKEYVKRTQKDYSMPFKLQVVLEVERGEMSATEVSGELNSTNSVNKIHPCNLFHTWQEYSRPEYHPEVPDVREKGYNHRLVSGLLKFWKFHS